MTEITLILSAWKRAHLLNEQIAACRAQTLAPTAIWIWAEEDAPARQGIALRGLGDNVFFTSTPGTYGRFCCALLAPTDLVAVLDDDMLPGPGFLAQSAALVERCGAAVAAGGMRLRSDDYTAGERFGWERRSASIFEVDIGLNAWVLKRSWLPVLWFDDPPNVHNGEDIHLSWALKHYLGRPTITPPQADRDVLGSQLDLGQDDVALCRMPSHRAERTRIVRHFLQRGWRTVNNVGVSAHA